MSETSNSNIANFRGGNVSQRNWWRWHWGGRRRNYLVHKIEIIILENSIWWCYYTAYTLLVFNTSVIVSSSLLILHIYNVYASPLYVLPPSPVLGKLQWWGCTHGLWNTWYISVIGTMKWKSFPRPGDNEDIMIVLWWVNSVPTSNALPFDERKTKMKISSDYTL